VTPASPAAPRFIRDAEPDARPGRGGVVGDVVELRRERRLVESRLEQRQLDLDRHQPLLGAVVEVALEPEAFVLSRGDDALARCAKLFDQPGVLEQHERRGRESLDHGRIGVERRVVNERGDGAAAADDRQHGAALRGPRQIDLRPTRVDVSTGRGDGEGEDEQRVPERLAHQRLQALVGDRLAAQRRDEPSGPCRHEHATPHLADDDRDGRRETDERLERPERPLRSGSDPHHDEVEQEDDHRCDHHVAQRLDRAAT
jgi:hypothetical protein